MREIDEIIKRVEIRVPNVEVHQLHVSHPGADDDGLWFFNLLGDRQHDIQIESSSGQCPFIVEHSGMRSTSDALTMGSVEEVVDAIVSYLSSIKND
jgi:hypothetical protein